LQSKVSWKLALLDSSVDEQARDELPAKLKAEADEFLGEASEAEAAASAIEADRWYDSREGQGTLTAFALASWNQMDAMADHAMPAHDRRHAMIKVPSTALEYVASEQVQGFARVGILGALLHDHGRWAEERIFGGPQRGLLHSRMSFVLARELLERHEMPALVKTEILRAVLVHTTGAGPGDPMPLKITVTADRDQLYGPEMILRLLHAAVPPDNEVSSVYGEKPGRSVLDVLEHFQRNRLPGPLFSMSKQVAWLQWVQRVFILMSESFEESSRRFAIDITGVQDDSQKRKQPLKLVDGETFDWESAWTAAHELRVDARSARTELEALLRSEHVAPSERYKRDALRKLDGLSNEHEHLLAAALAWTAEQLRINDERQTSELRKIHDSPWADELITNLSSLLLGGKEQQPPD
jgi:hypothetical protein